MHRALYYVSLPFRNRFQIQNRIQFTFANSQFKFEVFRWYCDFCGFLVILNYDFTKVNCIRFWSENGSWKVERDIESSMHFGQSRNFDFSKLVCFVSIVYFDKFLHERAFRIAETPCGIHHTHTTQIHSTYSPSHISAGWQVAGSLSHMCNRWHHIHQNSAPNLLPYHQLDCHRWHHRAPWRRWRHRTVMIRSYLHPRHPVEWPGLWPNSTPRTAKQTAPPARRPASSPADVCGLIA